MKLQEASRRALRLLSTMVPAASGFRILAYHLIGGETGTAVDVAEDCFRRHLRSMNGTVRPLRDWRGGQGVALTFDDAFANFYERVWPILSEHQAPAALFVPVGFIEGSSPSPLRGAAGCRAMSWSQLREVAASGLITIGSHSYTHVDLRKLADSELETELRDSRTALEDRLGVAVDAFCYPKALWSRRVVRRAAQHYALAVAAGGRSIRRGRANPLRLPRIPIKRDQGDDITPVLQGPAWMEELVADKVRRHVL